MTDDSLKCERISAERKILPLNIIKQNPLRLFQTTRQLKAGQGCRKIQSTQFFPGLQDNGLHLLLISSIMREIIFFFLFGKLLWPRAVLCPAGLVLGSELWPGSALELRSPKAVGLFLQTQRQGGHCASPECSLVPVLCLL